MKKNKLLIQNSITYAIVVACWILVQILGATGHMTSLLKGLLVPLCIYVILAVSLNLTVGILGELSLGHAGFMCVGAFTGAFFTKCMENAIPSVGMRFFLALLIGAAVAGVFGIIIGIPVLRLKGDYLAIVTLAFGEIIKNLINVMYVGRVPTDSIFLSKILPPLEWAQMALSLSRARRVLPAPQRQQPLPWVSFWCLLPCLSC